jgi:hypothetical protein
LRKHGHEVVAVGRKSAVVAGVQIETEPPVVNDIDTVTLYLNPTAQKAYYDFIVVTPSACASSLIPERKTRNSKSLLNKTVLLL